MLNTAIKNSILKNGLLFKNKNQLKKIITIQCNYICHKNDLDPEIMAQRLPPFPYKEKKLSSLSSFFNVEGIQPCFSKFTENTKIVTVEGNIGSGKEPFAKKLAEELGMVYFPDISADWDYKFDDGFDYRDINKNLPEDCQWPDFESSFRLGNPYHVALWQISVLRLRTFNYLRAMTEMLNTGYGVVLERSPWSDSVFSRSFNDLNLVGPEFMEYYWDLRSRVLTEIYRPHVVIYLDVPVDKCLESAQRKNMHNAGKYLDEDFLKLVEKNYKDHFIPRIEKHSEVLRYQYKEPITEKSAADEVELVVYDLSNNDMDNYLLADTINSDKFDDWRNLDSDERYQKLRLELTNDKRRWLEPFLEHPYFVDELNLSQALLQVKYYVSEIALDKREEKIDSKLNFFKKYFPQRETYDEKDVNDWFVKTGYNIDNV